MSANLRYARGARIIEIMTNAYRKRLESRISAVSANRGRSSVIRDDIHRRDMDNKQRSLKGSFTGSDSDRGIDGRRDQEGEGGGKEEKKDRWK
jgi:hypothetical protein